MFRFAAVLVLFFTALPALGFTASKVFQTRAEFFLLSEEMGECTDGGKSAVYIGPAGAVSGCWFLKWGVVWMMWKDGDHSEIPLTLFKDPKDA